MKSPIGEWHQRGSHPDGGLGWHQHDFVPVSSASDRFSDIHGNKTSERFCLPTTQIGLYIHCLACNCPWCSAPLTMKHAVDAHKAIIEIEVTCCLRRVSPSSSSAADPADVGGTQPVLILQRMMAAWRPWT